MPTVLRFKGYRFFFFSLENSKPAHIHVEYGDKLAKYWLDPVNLASSYGFKSHELSELNQLINQHKTLFLEKWYEFFSH